MNYLKHFLCLSLIAVVPFGYYFDDSDSVQVRMRLAAGRGEYATIIRNCNGTLQDIHTGEYSDYGGEIAFKPNPDQPFVVGIRGGHLSADSYSQSILGVPVALSGPTENGYINPYFAIEGRFVGFSLGWLRNIGPDMDKDLFKLDGDFRSTKDYGSMHLRVGSFRNFYVIGSFNEGVPIVSQYGFFLLGAGYGGVENWHFLTGISAGFYEEPGFHVGISRKLGHLGSADFSFRYGTAQSETERGLSLGWSYPIK